MDTGEIKKILIAGLSIKEVHVVKNDNNHYQIIVIDNCFISMTTLQRQKVVYKLLMKHILDGRIHSISIQVFTVEEWAHESRYVIK